MFRHAYEKGLVSCAFIRAIPGCGKTTLARQRPERFIDSDDVARVFDGKTATTFESRIMSSESTRLEFLRDLRRTAHGRVVLCNFEPTRLGVAENLIIGRYAYRPDEYLAHLLMAGRADLFRFATTEQLRQWAASYETLPSVTFLRPGQYLANIL